MSSKQNDCTGCGFCMIVIIAVADLAKIVDSLIMKNWVELIIIIISILSSCSCWDRFTEDRINMPRSALVLTATVTAMEWIKHMVNVSLGWELDVNGCKLL